MARIRFSLVWLTCIWSVLVVPGVTAQGGNGSSNSTDGEGLHSLARKAGKLYFGTATETNNFNDEAYMRVLNKTGEFGLVVPENSQKWESVQPRQGEFTFANSDWVGGVAMANQQMFRCHTLTWFQQLPIFVQTTQWTRETLTAAIEAHISNVVGHFAGQCYAWDVVNEAVNENGTFRNSVFFRTLGTDFIPISFRAAAAADPATKLYYNDFNIEFPGNKSTAALGIVRMLKGQGVRIDGVGFQAHFTVGRTPTREQLAAHLNRFVDLDVDVSYTELDIRQPSLPANASQQQQQARDYVSAVGACLDVPRCVGVILWQHTDKYSWIPSTFPGEGDACLFDANMTKKVAYTSVSSLLLIAAASAAAVSSAAAATVAASVTALPTSAPNSTLGSNSVADATTDGVSASIVTDTVPAVPGSGNAVRDSIFNGAFVVTLVATVLGALML